MQSSYPPNLSGLYPIRWPAQLNDVKAFRLALSQYSDWANEQFVSADIDTLVQHRSYFIDSLLTHLWQCFKLTNTSVCLLAVGG
ncbi:MAG: hypothetical protein C0463_09050, partial [Idiomarina sp.]|nr:hypothetical protein [Idiomarina sp.]